LQEARPVRFEGNVLTLGFDPGFADQLDLVNTPKTHALLQTKLQELGHPGVQIRFLQIEGLTPTPARTDPSRSRAAAAGSGSAPASHSAAAPPAPTPEPPRNGSAAAESISLDEFKNDPLIQRALEIFKGQIAPVA
jgi:hypothetical protein